MLKSYIISLLIMTPSLAGADNGEGGAVSGGGDAYSAQFTKIGYDVLQRLKFEPLDEVSNELLAATLITTRVTSQNKMILNGKEVDAINTPSQKLIQISRTRWDALNDKPKEKFILVAHEYFSVMGLEDSRYQISKKLFDNPGAAMVRYDCTPFPEIEYFNEFHMTVYLYDSFVSTNFYFGKKDTPVYDIKTLYTIAIDTVDKDSFPLKTSAVISIGWGLMTQMIALPFPDPDGTLKTGKNIPVTSKVLGGIIGKMETVDAPVTCDITRLN